MSNCQKNPVAKQEGPLTQGQSDEGKTEQGQGLSALH